jgi:hypothetical protein
MTALYGRKILCAIVAESALELLFQIADQAEDPVFSFKCPIFNPSQSSFGFVYRLKIVLQVYISESCF